MVEVRLFVFSALRQDSGTAGGLSIQPSNKLTKIINCIENDLLLVINYLLILI